MSFLSFEAGGLHTLTLRRGLYGHFGGFKTIFSKTGSMDYLESVFVSKSEKSVKIDVRFVDISSQNCRHF